MRRRSADLGLRPRLQPIFAAPSCHVARPHGNLDIQAEPAAPIRMIERRSRVGGWSIAIVGMIAGLVVYTLRYALLPFVFAIVVGFVLDPVVAWSAAHLQD